MDKQPTNNRRPSVGRQHQPRPSNRTLPGRTMTTSTGRSVSRGAAIRAQNQAVGDANRVANQYLDAASKQTDRPRRANLIDDSPKLKVIGLGGHGRWWQ